MSVFSSRFNAFCPHFRRAPCPARRPPSRDRPPDERGASRRVGGRTRAKERARLFVRSPSREPILVPKVRICFADFLVCIARYRPEASRLGDLMRSFGTCSREIVLRLLGFSRARPERTGRRSRKDVAFRPRRPPRLRSNRFGGGAFIWRPYQRKDSSSRGPGSSSPRAFALPPGRVAQRPPADARGVERSGARKRGPANLRVEARESTPDSLSVGRGPVGVRASFRCLRLALGRG